jgi:hypothetical protein
MHYIAYIKYRHSHTGGNTQNRDNTSTAIYIVTFIHHTSNASGHH